jgi:hypothetical protein
MKKISCLTMGLMLTVCTYAQNNSSTIEDLQNEIRSLELINSQLRAEISRLKSEKSSTNYAPNNGEEYRIQLGVQNNAISTLASPKVVSGSMINGKMVYDIGGFQNPNDAFSLSQELRKLNLAGSFVTRYYNGIRDVSYKYESNGMPSSTVNYTPPKSSTSQRSSYNSESGAVNFRNKNTPAKKSTVLVIED